MTAPGPTVHLTRIPQSPCKDCKRRKQGCHDVKKCKAWAGYVEQKKKEWAVREELRLEKKDRALRSFRFGGR